VTDQKPPIDPNPGLGRRIDLHAAINPSTNRVWLWVSGLFAAWTLIGGVVAALGEHWGVAAIFLATCLSQALMFWRFLIARRRIPETKRSIDERLNG
jgi:hypothetical protein